MWTMENIWKTVKDILIPCLVAGLIWLVTISNNNHTDILLLRSDVANLQKSHYTPKDAALVNQQLFELNRRLERIETLLNKK